MYHGSIPQLRAQRELHVRKANSVLDERGWFDLYLAAYRDQDLAAQAAANYTLAKGDKADG